MLAQEKLSYGSASMLFLYNRQARMNLSVSKLPLDLVLPVISFFTTYTTHSAQPFYRGYLAHESQVKCEQDFLAVLRFLTPCLERSLQLQ